MAVPPSPGPCAPPSSGCLASGIGSSSLLGPPASSREWPAPPAAEAEACSLRRATFSIRRLTLAWFWIARAVALFLSRRTLSMMSTCKSSVSPFCNTHGVPSHRHS
eukprot:3341157-Prymnesium_polylepis.1